MLEIQDCIYLFNSPKPRRFLDYVFALFRYICNLPSFLGGLRGSIAFAV